VKWQLKKRDQAIGLESFRIPDRMDLELPIFETPRSGIQFKIWSYILIPQAAFFKGCSKRLLGRGRVVWWIFS